jgi:hypothetical protein
MRRFGYRVRQDAAYAVLMLVVTIGVIGSLASPAARAENAWTCGGTQSAACAISLSAQGCPPPRQVCDGSSDAFSNTGSSTGCVCLPSCTSSATCGTGEACIATIGNHCTSRFACNSNAGCPADATCQNGFCSKVASCTSNFECPASAPDCVGGVCAVKSAGQCTANDQCNTDPCAGPQRCDLASNRCVSTGARVCADMPGAQCVASAGQARCMLPACTSDAQCSTDPCAGTPQRCNVASGRCEPGDKATCGEGQVCYRVMGASNLALCVPLGRNPLVGGRLPVTQFDPSDFEIIWSPDPPTPIPGGRGYQLRMSLPGTVLRDGAQPSNLRVTVHGADRGIAIDGMLALPGQGAKWTRDSASGAWRWKRESASGAIDSATLTPQGERVRLDVRGRMVPGVLAPDPGKAILAADVTLDWTGATPKVSETTVVIDACKSAGDGRRATVVCAGRPVPKK